MPKKYSFLLILITMANFTNGMEESQLTIRRKSEVQQLLGAEEYKKHFPKGEETTNDWAFAKEIERVSDDYQKRKNWSWKNGELFDGSESIWTYPTPPNKKLEKFKPKSVSLCNKTFVILGTAVFQSQKKVNLEEEHVIFSTDRSSKTILLSQLGDFPCDAMHATVDSSGNNLILAAPKTLKQSPSFFIYNLKTIYNGKYPLQLVTFHNYSSFLDVGFYESSNRKSLLFLTNKNHVSVQDVS